MALLTLLASAALARDRAFLRSWPFLGFHLLGPLDFVGAVAAGLVARGTVLLPGLQESTAALGEPPLVLIPWFAVLVWICLHILALLQRADARRRADAAGAASARPATAGAGRSS